MCGATEARCPRSVVAEGIVASVAAEHLENLISAAPAPEHLVKARSRPRVDVENQRVEELSIDHSGLTSQCGRASVDDESRLWEGPMILKMTPPLTPNGRRASTPFAGRRALPAGFPALRSSGATSYDPNWAYALSVMSGWAYAEPQVFADVLAFCGFLDCTVTPMSVENDAMFIVANAYFVRCKAIGVLVFRGTEPASLINWLTDADSIQYTFGSGTASFGAVHSGFYANVQALWSDIAETLTAAFEDGLRDLYITGHSLGGAMAVITAARIFEPKQTQVPLAWRDGIRGVYTYGQPMVGSKAFADTFDPLFGHMLYRHIYDDDIVPCLPPESVDEDFVHFGPRWVAPTRDESWKGPYRDREPPPDRRATLFDLVQIAESFVTRRIDAFRKIPGLYSLDDHSPRGYIDVSRNSIAATRVVATKPAQPSTLEQAFRKLLQGPRWMDRRTLTDS